MSGATDRGPARPVPCTKPRGHTGRRPTSRDRLIASSRQSDPAWAAGSIADKTGARINRRVDLALLPLLSLLYLFNGLDRSNIGNAQTQGWRTAHEPSIRPCFAWMRQ